MAVSSLSVPKTGVYVVKPKDFQGVRYRTLPRMRSGKKSFFTNPELMLLKQAYPQNVRTFCDPGYALRFFPDNSLIWGLEPWSGPLLFIH